MMPGTRRPLSSYITSLFFQMWLDFQICPGGHIGFSGAELMAWSENQNWRQRTHHGVQKKTAGVDMGRCRTELPSFYFSRGVSVAKFSCIAKP